MPEYHPSQERAHPRQMELNTRVGDGEEHHAEQTRLQVEEARAQAAYYEQRHAEWVEQRRDLEKITLQKTFFSENLNEVGTKISNCLKRIEMEIDSLEREEQSLEQIQGCLHGHLKILSAMQPQQWSPEGLSDRLREALPKLERAENDYDEAYVYGRQLRHSKLFDKKPGDAEANALSWAKLKEQLLSGLFFHLPLFLLILMTWGVASLINK